MSQRHRVNLDHSVRSRARGAERGGGPAVTERQRVRPRMLAGLRELVARVGRGPGARARATLASVGEGRS